MKDTDSRLPLTPALFLKGRGGICRKPLFLLAGFFVVSRVVFYLLGIRFDASPLTRWWQYLDPELLRTHLVQSLWFLHSQPPLYNLGLGLILKVFPGDGALGFWMANVVIGLALLSGTYLLLIRLGVGHKLSAVLAGLLIVSPTCILYENWLYYPYLLMAVLTLAALFLHRFATADRDADGIVFAALLGLAALTVNFFHLVWLLAILLGVVLLRPVPWRRALRLFAVPVLLVLFWYTKSLVMFGSFTSTSWLGMNLARATTAFVPLEERKQMVSEGLISPVSLVFPFSRLDAYRPYVDPPRMTGIRALDEEFRTGGEANFNHLGYIEISHRYLRDDLYLLRARPRAYLRSLLDAGLIYFLPASANNQLAANRDRIRFWTLGSELLQGRLMYYVQPELQRTDMLRFYRQKTLNLGFLLLIGYVLALIYCARRIPAANRDPAQRLTLLFIGFNLTYVALAGTFLEVGENMRFRSMVDPLLLVVLGRLAADGGRRLRRRRT